MASLNAVSKWYWNTKCTIIYRDGFCRDSHIQLSITQLWLCQPPLTLFWQGTTLQLQVSTNYKQPRGVQRLIHFSLDHVISVCYLCIKCTLPQINIYSVHQKQASVHLMLVSNSKYYVNQSLFIGDCTIRECYIIIAKSNIHKIYELLNSTSYQP